MLDFLYVAVSWVLLRWHNLFEAVGFDSGSGLGWALSIVFLVITARLLLFRLFIKQVHYQRNMQRLQPQIQKLREKHKNDRTALNRDMMALQQNEGFNPLSGCLPIALQMPVFLGLYHVLRHLSNSQGLCARGSQSHLLSSYTFTRQETCQAAQAKIFSAPLAASFNESSAVIRALGGDPTSTRVVLLILLIISAVATFSTQLMVRATAVTPPEGTAATVQKLMLYVIPVGVLASGLLFHFPLGVLLYWFANNLWTLTQQAYVVRFHPPADPVALGTTGRPIGELGKSLAPRPGQRPVRSQMTKQSVPGDDSPSDPVQNVSMTKSDVPAGRNAPRPGQRPNRVSGKRPPAKRPTQAKKRR